ALREIKSRYVEPMSDQELTDIAIRAMAGRDRYSAYLPPAEYKTMRAENEGAFTGLGLRYEPQGEHVRITDTVPGSPAERAGLRAGDLIRAVDQQAVDGQEMATVKQLLSGPLGAAVSLTVSRDGAPAPFDVSVTREEIKVPSVKHAALGAVGYIQIMRFDRQTYSGVSTALRSLRERAGPELRGFVLDLRHNPGGLVNASVKVADAFLEQGTILTAKGRDPDANRTYTARAGDEAGGLPVVVLVNGKSASAAEILTGALKDHRRAVVIGTRTFGKGIIQSIIPFDGGSALKLTTARYFTPSGHSIHEVGIAPDETVAMDDAKPAPFPPNAAVDQPLARALSILTAGPASRPQRVSLGAR
ncbi:S41 family peptidase, partial [Azospirillum sp.]|uniref:S41 family peptidase n=1 Tax=Azospirillum sp. TaxID=34012 RepID=UPI002D44737A